MYPERYTVITRKGEPIIRTDSLAEAKRYAKKIQGKVQDNEH